MAWTDDYIGIPFAADGRDASGCDCWGLVRMVYQNELGIELPVHSGAFCGKTVPALRQRAQIIAGEISRRWEKVSDPQEFDVVLLRKGKISCHVGTVTSKQDMLHIDDGIDACIEAFDGLMWGKKVTGFYRLK